MTPLELSKILREILTSKIPSQKGSIKLSPGNFSSTVYEVRFIALRGFRNKRGHEKIWFITDDF